MTKNNNATSHRRKIRNIVIAEMYQVDYSNQIEQTNNSDIYGIISPETGEPLPFVAKIIFFTKITSRYRFENERVVLKRLKGIPGVLHPVEVEETQDYGIFIFPLMHCNLLDLTHDRYYERVCMICILRQLCTILSECHKRGVYHLDIKPDNILVSSSGSIFFIDFAFGRCTTDPRSGVHGMLTYGTLAYSPPEVVLGHNTSAELADCWGLGLTALVCCNRHVSGTLLSALESRNPVPSTFEHFNIVREYLEVNVGSKLLRDILSSYLLIVNNRERKDLSSLIDSGLLSQCDCNLTKPIFK